MVQNLKVTLSKYTHGGKKRILFFHFGYIIGFSNLHRQRERQVGKVCIGALNVSLQSITRGLWYIQLRGRESTCLLLPYDAFASKCLLSELQMPVDKFKIKSFSKEVEALYYLLRPKRKQTEQADKGIYILKQEKKIKKIFVIARLANWVQMVCCFHVFNGLAHI